MSGKQRGLINRRHFLTATTAAGAGLALGAGGLPTGATRPARRLSDHRSFELDMAFPAPEQEGGWTVATPGKMGVDAERLEEAITFHDTHPATTGHGGALVIVHKGRMIGESYVTGSEGGPQPWNAESCNDMKSSTKSVFGTAVGVFLREFQDRIGLDSLLVGNSREESLIPQIWEQPITDERKKAIRVKDVISMTSGHETSEPWLVPTPRQHYPEYSGPFQMYEYCFGWWHFDRIAAHHTLSFQPGTSFKYSNYGLEQLALAMRNISGELVGPYIYDRVLGRIGMNRGIRDNQFRDMPYSDGRELNFSDEPGWGVGGGEGCDAYGADKSDSPLGYNSIVGSTFRCTARDFARLAHLWLNRGRWKDEQLVPDDWMQLATRRYVRDDGTTPSNYGYTFWVQDELEGVPPDLYMSRGHNMNHSYVIPSLDLVIVRQGNENRQPRGEPALSNALIQKIVLAFG